MDTCALVQAVSASILPNVGGLWMAFVNKKALREWYYKLNMPKNFPSNWVFGPMWTSLNTAMGYTSYLVWRDGGGFNGPARCPLMVYAVHLGFNWALSPIYFGARSVKWGFYASIPYTLSVYATGATFYRVNRTAACLFIPYALWCTFQAYLSYQVYKMNPKEYEQILD